MRMNQEHEILADWPEMERLKDGTGVRITGRYASPKLPDRTGWVALWFGIVLWGAFVGLLRPLFDNGTIPSTGSGIMDFVVQLGLPPLLAYLCALLFRRWLMKVFAPRLDVRITEDAIQLGRKRFKRYPQLQFSHDRHHKAIKEAQQNSGRTYREALEVIMHYGEKRIVIAEMLETDMEKADALVMRLQNLCDGMDSRAASRVRDQTERPLAAPGDFGPEPDVL